MSSVKHCWAISQKLALIGVYTRPSPQIVCVHYTFRHIVDSTELKQVCCGVKNVTEQNYLRVHCELRAQSTWLQILDSFKNLFTIILVLYSTALPLLLPDWIINLQHEYEKDKSMQTQIRNNQAMPDQQNELDEREDRLR